MKMSKIKLAAISGAALVTVASSGVVLAATTDTTGTSLASKIAAKIGLGQSDVQKVLDAAHDIRDEEMQTRMSERLDQLVTDGKITAAQKQLIADKQKELQAQREANKDTFQNLSETERKAKMDAERTALEQWAKDNGIDLKYIMPMGGPGGRGHGMGGRGMMDDSNSSSTSSSSSTTN